jgi:hypothetical protein
VHDQYDAAAGQLPEFPQGVYCWINDCLPEDFERSFVLQAIDDQGLYNRDGTLTTSSVAALLTEACWEVREVPSSDCLSDAIDLRAESIQCLQ